MVANRRGRRGDHDDVLELVHETDEREIDLEEAYDAIARLLLGVHQRRRLREEVTSS